MPRFDVSRKQLVVAMDHGRARGVTPGLEDAGRVIDTMIEAGADAILTSYGIVKRYRERLIGRIPTILRLDGGPSRYRRRVIASCPAPVLIAGGSRMDNERAVLQVVRDTLDAGSRGVVFGRNIWQSPNPAKMVEALRHLIHHDGTVDQAALLLR